MPLVTNQVEFQPLLNQDILLAAADETGIPLSSYCSVARGEVFKYPLFAEIGAGYGKSAAQVVLRWILQKGVAINTMSTKPANIAENFDGDGFHPVVDRHGADRGDEIGGLPGGDEGDWCRLRRNGIEDDRAACAWPPFTDCRGSDRPPFRRS